MPNMNSYENNEELLQLYDDINAIYMPLTGKLPVKGQKWKGLDESIPVDLEKNNIAILTGQKSGITALDIDTSNDGMETWELIKQHIDIPDTPTARTPSGGLHLLFNHVPCIANSTNMITMFDHGIKKKVGIDTRNDGGYICAPPSVYQTDKPDKQQFNGIKYEWITEPTEEVADMPQALIDMLMARTAIVRTFNTTSIYNISDIESEPVRTTYTPKQSTIADTSNIRDVVMGLNPARADDRDDWVKVIFALGTIARQSGENLSGLAIEFSKQSDKFSTESDVLEKYDNTKEAYTAATLYDMLKKDNPTLFKSLCKKQTQQLPDFSDPATQRELIERFIEPEELDDDEQEPEWFYQDNSKFKVEAYAKKYDINNFFKACIFHIENGGNHYVLTKNRDDQGLISYKKISSVPFQKLNDFEVWDKSDGKMVKMSDLANKHYISNTYSNEVFRPYCIKNPLSSQYVNTFNGFRFKFRERKFSEPPASISLILWHIKSVLADDDDRVYMFIIRWTGHLFRYPEIKPNIALILYSFLKGVGKNIYTEFLRNILTDQLYFQTADIDQLLKNFNAGFSRVLLKVLDEATSGCTIKTAQKMKNVITRTMKAVEPKGGEVYTVPDYDRYIITSNTPQPIKPEVGQRRYQMCKVSDRMVNNKPYFDKLRAAMNDPQVQQDFFDYVSNLPNLKEFGAHEMVKTEYGEQLVKDSRPSIYNYLATIAEGHRDYEFEGKDQVLKIRSTDFLHDYNNWCEAEGEYKMTGKNVKMELDRIGIKYKNIRSDGHIYKGYMLFKEELQKYV